MREKIASRDHRRSRRTVAQSPTERFAFSIFTPRSSFSLPHTPPPPPLHYAISPVPRLISDHRSSFVRSVMGVPLLSAREHARRRRRERKVHSSRLSLRALSPSRSFFSIASNFRTRSVSLSMQSPLPRPNVPRCFEDLPCLSDSAN